jgi:hypothetical protein
MAVRDSKKVHELDTLIQASVTDSVSCCDSAAFRNCRQCAGIGVQWRWVHVRMCLSKCSSRLTPERHRTQRTKCTTVDKQPPQQVVDTQ